jgi:hypothetical protein
VFGQVSAMSDDDGAGSQLPQQSFQISQQSVRCLFVETCCYLIGEEQAWVVGQCDSEREASPVPIAELGRLPSLLASAQTHGLEQCGRALATLARRCQHAEHRQQ